MFPGETEILIDFVGKDQSLSSYKNPGFNPLLHSWELNVSEFTVDIKLKDLSVPTIYKQVSDNHSVLLFRCLNYPNVGFATIYPLQSKPLYKWDVKYVTGFFLSGKTIKA